MHRFAVNYVSRYCSGRKTQSDGEDNNGVLSKFGAAVAWLCLGPRGAREHVEGRGHVASPTAFGMN